MNYVPQYTKKKQKLARNEQDLRRLMARGAAAHKILAAALEVRDARVRVLRARRATIPSTGRYDERLAKIDGQIQQSLKTPVAVVLDEFGFLRRNMRAACAHVSKSSLVAAPPR